MSEEKEGDHRESSEKAASGRKVGRGGEPCGAGPEVEGAHPGRGSAHEETPGVSAGTSQPRKAASDLPELHQPPPRRPPFPLHGLLGTWDSVLFPVASPVRRLTPGRHVLNVRSADEELNK